jgi:hypothetical protein
VKELRRVTFEPAKGGVISRTETRSKRSSNSGPEFEHGEEMGVHPNLKHAQEHLGKMMAGCFKDGAKEEKSEE